MSHYHNILVATDLNTDSCPILNRAIILAKEHGAQLNVISVVPEVPFYLASGGLSSLVSIEEQYQIDIQSRIKKARANYSYQAEFVVKHGSAKTEIIHYAEEIKADLIVIGSHKHSDMSLMLGSTAHAVLQRADCDILVIRVNGDYA